MKLFSVILVFAMSIAAQAVEVKSTLTVTSAQPFNQSVNYHFGQTFTNQTRYVRYDITNNGDQYLPFQQANMFGMFFDARHTCQNGIQPFGRCWVEIRYWPAFEGFHHGQLEMLFANFNDIIFYVSGQAIR